MKSKLLSAGVVCGLLLFGTAPIAHGKDRPEDTFSVSLQSKPSVRMGSEKVALGEVASDIGEKHFSGTSKVGDVVRVVLFEKPAKEPAMTPVDPPVAIDGTQGAEEGSVPIQEESIPRGTAPKPTGAMKPSIVTAATDSKVSITWAASSPSMTYDIYKDGQKVQTTTTNSYTAYDLAPDTRYLFEVRDSGVDSGQATSERTIPVQTLSEGGAAEVVPFTYQPYTTAFVYETFIPEAQVSLNLAAVTSCNAVGQSGITFGGDNRSYRTPGIGSPYDTPDYRTMMFTNINWDNAAPYDVINLKHVAPTKKYKNGSLVETKTASASQMYFKEIQKGGSYAQVRYDHAAGNPFCSIGNIRYNVVNRFYRSGVVESVGYRQKAPAHEGYARFNNTGAEFWVPMFRLPNSSFNCLFEHSCATETINARQAR